MENGQPQESKWNIWRIISVIADITSITGLSLLYLTQIKGVTLDSITFIKTVIVVIVAFGYLLLVVSLVHAFLKNTKEIWHWLYRFAALSIGLPIVCGFAVLFAGITAEALYSLVDKIAQGKPFIEPTKQQNSNSQ